MTKKYQHDCDRCTFLGTYSGHYTHSDGSVGRECTWDLYYCGTHTTGTLLCRYGNEGHEYCSFEINKELPHIDLYPYKECYERAIAKGLYCVDISEASLPCRDMRTIIVACDKILDAVTQFDFSLGYEFKYHSPIIRELKRVEEHLDEKEDPLDKSKAKIYRAFIEYVEVLKEEASRGAL